MKVSLRSGRALPFAAVAVTVSLLAACSGSSDSGSGTDATGSGTQTTGSQTTAGTATPSSSPSATSSRVDATGAPASLRTLATALYEGKPVTATGAAVKPMSMRKPTTSAVKVTGTEGIWRGTPIAALTSGGDTTLAVRGAKGWEVVGGWWPSMGLNGPYLGGKRHVLFIGSDARTERGQNLLRTNADALQLVGVDGSGGAGIMGMARDLYVPIAGGGKGKINSGLSVGGPEGQTRTVANLMGVPVQGYVLVGMQDFSSMVNALGGIELDSPLRVRDVPKGKSRVYGPDALWYTRERKSMPNGDISRSNNQGFLMYSVAVQVRAGGPKELVRTLNVASPKVRSNLTATQALTLGAWVYKADVRKLGRAVVKGPIGTSPGGASIVVLGPEGRAIMARFRDGNLG